MCFHILVQTSSFWPAASKVVRTWLWRMSSMLCLERASFWFKSPDMTRDLRYPERTSSGSSWSSCSALERTSSSQRSLWMSFSNSGCSKRPSCCKEYPMVHVIVENHMFSINKTCWSIPEYLRPINILFFALKSLNKYDISHCSTRLSSLQIHETMHKGPYYVPFFVDGFPIWGLSKVEVPLNHPFSIGCSTV